MVLLNNPQAFRVERKRETPSLKGKHFSWTAGVSKNTTIFAGVAFLAAALASGVTFGVKYAATHLSFPLAHTAPLVVPMTVGQGETFWSLARKYGSSDDYILDRVNALAKANGMTAHASLVPGQRILVPVSNQQEVARLQTHLAKR